MLRHDSLQQPPLNVGLECKKKNVNTPEVSTALDLLKPYNWVKWLILQFRNHALEECTSDEVDPEGQQVLSATFLEAVRELLSVRMERTGAQVP